MLPCSLVVLAIASLLPNRAAGQSSTFSVESEVLAQIACLQREVRIGSPAQRNLTSAFTTGTQLYDYLKVHKCNGLTASRAKVYDSQGQYICICDLRAHPGSLDSWRGICSKSPEHDADHGEADECSNGRCVAFEVASQATVTTDPRERSFDDPPFG